MNENEKKYPMKLNENYYAVTANDLIKGKQKMTLREAQLLFITISQVVKEDKDFKTYTTTVSELAAFMNIDENSLYHDLESICESLVRQTIKVQIGGKKAKEKDKWKIFSWVSSAEYDSGKLTLRLSDDIKPFLLELESYYSQTQLGVLMSFRSYYAVRLFQYLKADFGEKSGIKEKYFFTCDDLRELFQTYVKDEKGRIIKELYKQNRDLLKKTIIPALNEIGKSDYAYVWDYKEHQATTRGRPLLGVSFKVIFFDSKEKKDFYMKTSKPIIERLQKEQEEYRGE